MRSAALILLLSIILSPILHASTWRDCPFGLEHDPHPGRCRLYVDTDQDGLCDRSQEEPKAKAETLSVPPGKAAAISSKKTGPVPSAQTSLRSRERTSNSPQKPDTAQPDTTTIELSAPVRPDPAKKPKPGHHVWEIMLSVTILAIGTELAIVRKKSLYLRLQTFWNWALFLSFLGCAATGIYFLLPLSVLRGSAVLIAAWHTDTGLAFIAIGLYHAVRRFPCMLRGLKSCLS